MTRNLTILVVDDHRAFCSTTAALLETVGHFPICAANGNEGLQMLEKIPIDVIITDILMPEKDGFEFISQVRQILPTLPIVAISGGGHALEKGYCLQTAKGLGAKVIVSKPFGMQQLLDAVDEAVDQARGDAAAHA